MEEVVMKNNDRLLSESYQSLTVNGYTLAEKPLKVEKLTVNGFLKCTDDIVCEEMLCNGTASFTGDVNISYLNCTGAVYSLGENTWTVQSITCTGAIKISSDIEVDKLEVKGSFTIKNDSSIKARSVSAEGSIAINGIIKAETISSFGFIYADTIIGKSIYIRTQKTDVSKALKSEGIDTTIPSIIGDEVELVNVKAQEVKGKYVKIGANCKIETVEYSNMIEIDESAQVVNAVKV